MVREVPVIPAQQADIHDKKLKLVRRWQMSESLGVEYRAAQVQLSIILMLPWRCPPIAVCPGPGRHQATIIGVFKRTKTPIVGMMVWNISEKTCIVLAQMVLWCLLLPYQIALILLSRHLLSPEAISFVLQPSYSAKYEVSPFTYAIYSLGDPHSK